MIAVSANGALGHAGLLLVLGASIVGTLSTAYAILTGNRMGLRLIPEGTGFQSRAGLSIVSEIVVPVMAVGYLACAVVVIGLNITEVPAVLGHIVKSALGLEQAVGGGVGVAVMQGIRRGLFSNEAGLGSAPNVAAVAYVPHPANQGIVQALSVFIDTVIICSATAFI